MFAALLACAAAFVPLPVRQAPAAPPAVYYAVGYPTAAVPLARYAPPARPVSGSATENFALHAAATGALAASLASLGVMGTFRSAGARRSAAMITMVETQEKEKTGSLNLLDKMRGVVAPTKPKEAAAKEEEQEDSKAMMQKVKDAGVAGIISYIFWEWAFWGVGAAVGVAGFSAATGHWPDFSNQDDLAKIGAEAFAFVNVARFAIPLRIGLALGTTPWVQANVVDKFQKKDGA